MIGKKDVLLKTTYFMQILLKTRSESTYDAGIG